MRANPLSALAACLLVPTAAVAAPTGLNVIPTTDIVPVKSYVLQVQNGNTSFQSPTFYNAPGLVFQSQAALTPRIEAGIDTLQLSDHDAAEPVFNIKGLVEDEDEIRPNIALGVENVANHAFPLYYLTISKTLNYDQQQRERFRAHHRRNRKLLGRRIHAGLMLSGSGALEPFLGTDIQLNESSLFQADWIDGPGNAISFGLVYVLSDQRTTLNPAFLFSNDNHRVNGFFVNISHQFGF